MTINTAHHHHTTSSSTTGRMIRLLFPIQAYFMLDELLLGGDIQETSKKNVLKAIAAQDLLQEEETPQGFFEDHGLG